jgi:hypothetical protein
VLRDVFLSGGEELEGVTKSGETSIGTIVVVSALLDLRIIIKSWANKIKTSIKNAYRSIGGTFEVNFLGRQCRKVCRGGFLEKSSNFIVRILNGLFRKTRTFGLKR